jgi:hypothetical protein
MADWGLRAAVAVTVAGLTLSTFPLIRQLAAQIRFPSPRRPTPTSSPRVG